MSSSCSSKSNQLSSLRHSSLRDVHTAPTADIRRQRAGCDGDCWRAVSQKRQVRASAVTLGKARLTRDLPNEN
jgi:hypothetical protein